MECRRGVQSKYISTISHCKNLDLKFVPAPADYTPPTAVNSADWHREPYVHILPVLCKDRSVYSSAVKDIISKWLADKVRSARNDTLSSEESSTSRTTLEV